MKKLTFILTVSFSAFLFACDNQNTDTNENNNTPAALDTAKGIVPDSMQVDSTRGDTSTMRQ